MARINLNSGNKHPRRRRSITGESSDYGENVLAVQTTEKDYLNFLNPVDPLGVIGEVKKLTLQKQKERAIFVAKRLARKDNTMSEEPKVEYLDMTLILNSKFRNIEPSPKVAALIQLDLIDQFLENSDIYDELSDSQKGFIDGFTSLSEESRNAEISRLKNISCSLSA